MGKYIIQWAVQGVLFLVGAGVDLMPGNTSWIPSVAIWSAAALWLIVSVVYYRKHRVKVNQDIKRVVEELLSIGIYTDRPVNITRILYYLRDKLAVGWFDYEVSAQDKLVLSQLSLHKIVHLEQRRRSSGAHEYDEGYWTLTKLGKSVISYLQANKQVLDKEGSLI